MAEAEVEMDLSVEDRRGRRESGSRSRDDSDSRDNVRREGVITAMSSDIL